jgi:hypothetical protein
MASQVVKRSARFIQFIFSIFKPISGQKIKLAKDFRDSGLLRAVFFRIGLLPVQHPMFV